MIIEQIVITLEPRIESFPVMNFPNVGSGYAHLHTLHVKIRANGKEWEKIVPIDDLDDLTDNLSRYTAVLEQSFRFAIAEEVKRKQTKTNESVDK